MVSLKTFIQRGDITESIHEAMSLIKDLNYKILLTSEHDKNLIYPRSAIKIFQALPFINSSAYDIFNLSEENIAISCSSHAGELKHMSVLNEWVNKTGIRIHQLKCGIHNPLDEKSSNKLLLSGNIPTQLHNNCAGKHLGMISGCLANKMNIDNYLDFDHPYQKLIQKSLENIMQSKIQKKCIGTDG